VGGTTRIIRKESGSFLYSPTAKTYVGMEEFLTRLQILPKRL
jgi:hypothetical protein